MTVQSGTNAGNYFFAYDGNGNVAALGNAADGTIAARYEYGPFGEPIRTSGTAARENPFRFSTKYQDDDSDLLYYSYRYYSSSSGRWPSRDPVGELGFKLITGIQRWGYAEELLLYRFVANDPIGTVDWLGLASNPCGTDECKCLGCIVFSEARGTEDACQKAVADVVKQRAWTGYAKNRSFCDVVAERDGGEFNGYKTPNYSKCCQDQCVNVPKGPQDKTERDKAFKNSECDVAAGSYANGANYLNDTSIGVPDWIRRKMDSRKAYEVNVSGCSKFRFYHVDP
jgi:RHS repeat-associated protein